MYKRYKKFNCGLFTNLVDGVELNNKELNVKQAEEAGSVGLILLSRTNQPNYNLYKHRSCGHESLLQPTHVRRNNFKCPTCYLQAVVENIKSTGHHFLHKTKTSYAKMIKPCGHIVDTAVGAERPPPSSSCRECFDIELSDVAQGFGYDYLRAVGKQRRLVRFKSCGHTKVVHQSQINKGNLVCRICKESEIAAEASHNGLRFISRNGRYGKYVLPCGCIKELRLDHAKRDSWICDIHCDTHYVKESKLYLIEFTLGDFSWLKLGFSKDIDLRKSTYGVSSDADFVLVKEVQLQTGRTAMLHEKELHRKYKQERYHKNKMKAYHKHNGYTECYPVHLKDTLVIELENIEKGF